jgi:hypothetical protein
MKFSQEYIFLRILKFVIIYIIIKYFDIHLQNRLREVKLSLKVNKTTKKKRKKVDAAHANAHVV